jgi:hypothetical protein
VNRRNAFQLAICRAYSSSNLTGLLYRSDQVDLLDLECFHEAFSLGVVVWALAWTGSSSVTDAARPGEGESRHGADDQNAEYKKHEQRISGTEH